MVDLFFSLCLSLLVVIFQVTVPGVALCLLVSKRAIWTLVDAFFLGLLWNAFISLLVVPFFYNTADVSFTVRIVSVLLVTFTMSLFIFGRKQGYKSVLHSVLENSVSKYHFWLSTGAIGIAGLFVFTHNLGFDDVAHLKYLNEAVAGDPYPVFRLLVGDWEAARYPLFGLILGQLGQGFSASSLFLYYLIGFSVLTAFILKIYEILLAGRLTGKQAFAFTLLVAAMLMVFSFDNYFNFGIYPLQQAKLLFILGVVYLFIGWGKLCNKLYFFIGTGLIGYAIVYHLNLLLLYISVIPLILLFIYFRTSNKKNWLIYSIMFFIPLFISTPSLLSSDHGFLKHKIEVEAPPSISTGPKVIVKKPSQFEALLLKAKKLLLWVKEGRYRSKYIARVFSLEIFMIPLLLILVLQVGFFSQFGLIVVVVSSLVIAQQLFSTIPKQFVASAFKSGTSWMLYDIARSGVSLKQSSSRVLTDPYTAFYLKLFGKKNIEVLDSMAEILSFSPEISDIGLSYTASRWDQGKNDQFLLNGRFWGLRAKKQWLSNDTDDVKFLAKDLQRFYGEGNIQRLGAITKNTLEIAKQQINLPFVIRSADINKGVDLDSYKQELISSLSDKTTFIYRHFAIVKLQKLLKGDELIFKLEGKGDADYMGHLSEVEKVKLKTEDLRGNRIKIHVEKDISEVFLVFKMDFGHLGELGTMQSISFTKTSQ